MIYNGDSDNQDIVTLCDDLANTTAVTYPIKEKTRAANKTLRAIWTWIFDAYGGWQYDDSNNTTDFPIATTGLINNQADYDIPPTSLTIRGVEVLAQNSTIYTNLIEITEEYLRDNNLSEASLFSGTGMPKYYRPIGSSIKLYPTPNFSQDDSIRVTFDRGATTFVSTDTTKQPGFASEFHEAVAVGMALEFARRNSLTSYSFLREDYEFYRVNIKKYYASRFQQKFPARFTTHDVTTSYL